MTSPTSPAMRQYQSIKAQHPTALVMCRMGDFYEMLGEDAVTAAGILQITLTRRRNKADEDGIPMCGVPYHAAEGYIGKLLDSGLRVALVEQLETPEEAKKARGSGAVVKRDVVRLFTPGTLTEDAYLGAQARYLVAVHALPLAGGVRYSVAWLDLSGAQCGVENASAERLGLVLGRLPVAEALTDAASRAAVETALPELAQKNLIREESTLFHLVRAGDAVRRAYGVAQVDGLGLHDEGMVTALGAILAYAELTQVGRLPPLAAPQVNTGRGVMAMDPATRRNLELTAGSASGRRSDSLLGVLDSSVTGPGGRLLARWVGEPLTVVRDINDRQEAIRFLVEHGDTRRMLRERLRESGDISRCVSRLLLGRGSPRDLGVLRQTATLLPELQTLLHGTPDLLTVQAHGMSGLQPLKAVLDLALNEDASETPLPALVRDGGFIRPGYDAELDAFRELSAHGNDKLAALERQEVSASGLSGMKLRYNQVWGYFFELTKVQADSGRIPPHFVHRQTTTNAQRYTTDALMTLERDLSHADSNALRREACLFEALVADVRGACVALLDAAMALATVDALAAMAETAHKRGWVRPVVDDTCAFDITGGKHPVVSARLADFMPNDCHLTDGKLWLITGPNMAGKSTFLRQNALLAILAQMGSFIPCERAHIGVCDAVYSRIGAGDNLAAGQSTFMVEMVETAQILNRASRNSLVILDELGRGTATYDGLAIAWACVEDIAQRLGCRTLFATHYHELTTLEDTLERVQSHQVAVKEWQGEIVFLHEVRPGAAAGSFGVQVAKLAGVPQGVVKRAGALLESFEKTARGNSKGVARVGDLGLFAAAPTPVAAPMDNPIEQDIKAMDVDNLSPKQALEELYRLKSLLNSPRA